LSNNSQKELRLALIGRGISHSRSKQMYEKLLGRKLDYTLLDIEIEESLPSLEELFSSFHGVSITTPYKQSYMSRIIPSNAAKAIGAINCLAKKAQGFFAENTDYLAVKEALIEKLKMHPRFKVVVIGSGVMSSVVVLACQELKISFELFSRKSNPDFTTRTFNNTDSFSPLLLINCCNREFVFNNVISGNIHFWDLNYNYSPHDFLRNKVEHFDDGLVLLERQAYFALQFWSIL
jgi:shikimate dehydrogenase